MLFDFLLIISSLHFFWLFIYFLFLMAHFNVYIDILNVITNTKCLFFIFFLLLDHLCSIFAVAFAIGCSCCFLLNFIVVIEHESIVEIDKIFIKCIYISRYKFAYLLLQFIPLCSDFSDKT